LSPSTVIAFAGSIPGDALSVPVEELERALAIVRKRLDRPTQLGSEVTGDTAGGGGTLGSGLAGTGTGGSATQALVLNPGDADGTPAALRKRVQQLQLALLTAQGELDRSDRMVRAPSHCRRTALHAAVNTPWTAVWCWVLRTMLLRTFACICARW